MYIDMLTTTLKIHSYIQALYTHSSYILVFIHRKENNNTIISVINLNHVIHRFDHFFRELIYILDMGMTYLPIDVSSPHPPQ